MNNADFLDAIETKTDEIAKLLIDFGNMEEGASAERRIGRVTIAYLSHIHTLTKYLTNNLGEYMDSISQLGKMNLND